MSKKKYDFARIGSGLLNNKDKAPKSLAEMLEDNINVNSDKSQINDQSSNSLVRTSFVIPRKDFNRVDDIALKCMKLGQKVSRADIFRIAINLLYEMDDPKIAERVNQLRKSKKTHV